MNEAYRKALGRTIAAKRNTAGINKTKLSLMIGINRGTLQLIEEGQENASIETLLRISQGLGVSFADLAVECERSLQPTATRPPIPAAILTTPYFLTRL